jgi:hypothetical protein
MEDMKGKTGPIWGWISVGEGGQIWWMYCVFVYENRTMKPVKIV